jgi:hypothetical protein
MASFPTCDKEFQSDENSNWKPPGLDQIGAVRGQ